jgi:hypothetical protein
MSDSNRCNLDCGAREARAAEKKSPVMPIAQILLLAGMVALSGCAGINRTEQATDHPPTDEAAAGIKVVRIHPSVAGQMLDMRYRVVDREKAKNALKRGAQIYLIDQASGTKLPVPDMAQVGKLLQRPDQGDSGKIYWIFFGNPGGMVKPGARVTLVVGDFQIKDILVE